MLEFLNYISSHLKSSYWKPRFPYCKTQKAFKQKFATVKMIKLNYFKKIETNLQCHFFLMCSKIVGFLK